MGLYIFGIEVEGIILSCSELRIPAFQVPMQKSDGFVVSVFTFSRGAHLKDVAPDCAPKKRYQEMLVCP